MFYIGCVGNCAKLCLPYVSYIHVYCIEWSTIIRSCNSQVISSHSWVALVKLTLLKAVATAFFLFHISNGETRKKEEKKETKSSLVRLNIDGMTIKVNSRFIPMQYDKYIFVKS